jgi:hypothetical protein
LLERTGTTMFEWDISSNAERLVALLPAVTIIAVVFV